MNRLLPMLALSWAVVSTGARAQDTVMVRPLDKVYRGTIKKESTRGVEIAEKKGAKETVQVIPAEEIVDIIYEVASVDVRINMYQPALQSEKEYNDSDPKKNAKRKANLTNALKKYGEAYAKVTEKGAKSHLEYKLAYLNALQALDDDAGMDAAIKRLHDFKTRHPNCWELGACLRLMGRLYLDGKQYKEAEDAFLELAQADVGDDVKGEAELAAVQVTIKAGQQDAALKRLQALAAKWPPDTLLQSRARVAQAECLAASKKNEEAVKLLREVARVTSDRNVKALAYNALGQTLYNADKLKDARWEFLWVDVVFNQSPAEHAKALYYLAKIFDKLGEQQRAQECRETLLSERAFAGLEWQRLAAKETRP